MFLLYRIAKELVVKKIRKIRYFLKDVLNCDIGKLYLIKFVCCADKKKT